MNALQQQLRGGILQHHAASPQLQSFDNLFLLGGSGQKNHANRMRRTGAHFTQRFEARHARHGQVQKHDVGLQLAGHPHRFGSVAGFANHLEIGFRLQKTAQAIAKNRMVIRNHNSYGLGSSIIHTPLPAFAGH